jgi:hypothetical protein
MIPTKNKNRNCGSRIMGVKKDSTPVSSKIEKIMLVSDVIKKTSLI